MPCQVRRSSERRAPCPMNLAASAAAGDDDARDGAAAARHGSLADGTPFPFPVTLEVPADAVPPDAGMLVLQDPEGAPLAVLKITERIQSRPAEPVRIA